MAAKNRESDFWEKSPVNTVYTQWAKNFVEVYDRFQDKCAFVFYIKKLEIGRPVDSRCDI